MADSISSMSDSELLALAVNLHDTIQATPADYGLTAPFVMSLDSGIGDFDTKLNKHNNSQA